MRNQLSLRESLTSPVGPRSSRAQKKEWSTFFSSYSITIVTMCRYPVLPLIYSIFMFFVILPLPQLLLLLVVGVVVVVVVIEVLVVVWYCYNIYVPTYNTASDIHLFFGFFCYTPTTTTTTITFSNSGSSISSAVWWQYLSADTQYCLGYTVYLCFFLL